MQCSFCATSIAEVAKMIEGPDATICDVCVARALEPNDDDLAGMPCNFCHELPARRRFARRDHVICDACIDLCCDILREARVRPQLPRAIARKRSPGPN